MAHADAADLVIDPAQAGLRQHHMKTSTIVFMIFCLCAAGAYGIEEMIPQAGPGLTIVMLMALPFFWSTPMGLVAAELGSAIPQEGGYYKWVQRACGEFWGFQAGWWRTISIYFDSTIYVVLAGSYLASVGGLSDAQGYGIKAALVIFFVYINLRGIPDVGMVSTGISILVMVAFAMVAGVGARSRARDIRPRPQPHACRAARRVIAHRRSSRRIFDRQRAFRQPGGRSRQHTSGVPGQRRAGRTGAARGLPGSHRGQLFRHAGRAPDGGSRV